MWALGLQAGIHRVASLRLESANFTSNRRGASGRKKDLAHTGKGLACNTWPGGHGVLPIQPRIKRHPELTTASLRLAPLKLLPFGGTARCRASGAIRTQDKNHDNPGTICATSAKCTVKKRSALQGCVTGITTLLMVGIAIFHFTWPARPSIIRLRIAAGARDRPCCGNGGPAGVSGQGSSFGGAAMAPRVVSSSIRAWPRRHRQPQGCKRDQAVADTMFVSVAGFDLTSITGGLRMELFSAEFFSALLAIIIIDLVLAGDNAIVIALAARSLPPDLRKRAVLWGTFGAIFVRTLMTLVVVWLLKIPGLLLIGGVLLVWIAYKLLADNNSGGHEVSAASNFWGAMKTIVVADAVMGLDNVLAVAGAAHGNFLLVVIGLLISIPIVIWGSQLILKYVERGRRQK